MFELANGYKSKTTFLLDFSIADRFGESAVKDTYDRAFAEWKSNVEYLTELVLVLNMKIWEHYKHDEDLAKLYEDLWSKTQEYVYDTLTGDDLAYYFRVMD